jgi:DNA polymerase elongation subunit (family B)
MSDFYLNAKQYGNKVLVRSIQNGRRLSFKHDYCPYLFVDSNKGEGEYKNISGRFVEKIPFESIRDAKDFIDRYKDVAGFNVYGMTDFVYPYINDRWEGEVQYDTDLINVVSTDIETMSDDGFPDIETADKEVTLITLSDRKKFIVLGCGDFVTDRDNVIYIKCHDEEDLLRKFILSYERLDPDILTGWNIEFFDVPYLFRRITRVLGDSWAKRLSPWGICMDRYTYDSHGNKSLTIDVVGLAVLDYLALYKKFTLSVRESYKLDFIGELELGEKKLDYSEYGSLHEFYVNDFQRFTEYNIRDTELIDMLEDKLKYIDLAISIAYDAKINFVDALTSVRMWDVIIHNYLMNKKIVVPQKKTSQYFNKISGGYVKDPVPGAYDWVVSFDLNSLYPHLISGYNISPEKFVEKRDGVTVDNVLGGSLAAMRKELIDDNVTITPNGCVWNREGQGFLGELMDKLYTERKRYKSMSLEQKGIYKATGDLDAKKLHVRYDKAQGARKVQLNSAYGALANQYFRWFNPDHAESVTMAGQLSIRWIERDINAYMNRLLKTDGVDYVIASDTDSIYINMADIVTKRYPDGSDKKEIVDYLDKVCSKAFEPYIDESYQKLADYVNAFRQMMKMKRECIADRGVWTGKKHYVLNVWNNEGVAFPEPELKYMGIEVVKSSTPAACREAMKGALKIIMSGDNDEIIAFVENFRKKFKTLPFEQIAFPRGVNGITKYYDHVHGWKPKCPAHVRGALVFNREVANRGLDKSLQMLRNGDKIRFAYLVMPNPVRSNIIAFPDGIPAGFDDIQKFVDFDTQFEKAFLGPIRAITDVVGWQLEHVATLEDFFG